MSNISKLAVIEDGAVIVYDLGATMSPGKILTDSTLCLVLLADEYPESEMVFAFARLGGKDIFVTYAETKDVLAYRDEKITSEIKNFLVSEGIIHISDLPYDESFTKAMTNGQTIVEYSSGLLKKLVIDSWKTILKAVP